MFKVKVFFGQSVIWLEYETNSALNDLDASRQALRCAVSYGHASERVTSIEVIPAV